MKNNETADIKIADSSLVDVICLAIEKMMQNVMTKMSAKRRAISWSLPHHQSSKRVVFDRLLYNLMSGKQQVPARPRDLRLNFPDDERTIDYGELSDLLEKLVRLQILQKEKGKFPFHRGRPNDKLSSERRGRRSYYNFSQLKNLIKEALDDSDTIKLINKKLISGENLLPFLKYSFATCFYLIRDNEGAFLNTFRSYGLSQQQLELNKKKQGSWVLFKDMSDTKLEYLADRYAKKAFAKWIKSNVSMIYEIAVILNSINVYPDLK